MTRSLVWFGCGVLIAAGWIVSASYLTIYIGHVEGKIDRPWIAWLTYARSGPDTWTMVVLGLAALFPSMALLMGAPVAYKLLHKPTRRKEIASKSLYGDSNIAEPQERARSGILTRRLSEN